MSGIQAMSMQENDIIEYLKRHPDLLLRNPDLINHLVPPSQHDGKTVVDFQKLMLERLQKQNKEALETQNLLVENSRANLNNQTRMHKAVLAMLDAQSFEEFIHIVCADMSILLNVDVVSVCMEVEDEHLLQKQNLSGVRLLRKGTVDELLNGRDTLLASETRGLDLVYGGAASLVLSQALIKLDISSKSPAGLLAFGSRNPHDFESSQGTELVCFLACVIERCIRRWLELPL